MGFRRDRAAAARTIFVFASGALLRAHHRYISYHYPIDQERLLGRQGSILSFAEEEPVRQSSR